jgi:hypothetical protein
LFALLQSSFAAGQHDAAFWKQIREHDFAVPAGDSAGKLALEIVDLAPSTDPALRDECGYEILATWVYRKHLLAANELEAVRRKLIPGMTFRIGETQTDSVFRRSFSALYLSILAAEDLYKPFLSDSTFKETLDVTVGCYAGEKDLRGYVPEKGWAHATAHVADLLKFLARNPKLTRGEQSKIVSAIAQRCRTTDSVFAWGEDARMAAALLSIVDRRDFDQSIFDEWFSKLKAENKKLFEKPTIDTAQYVAARAQADVLVHLAAKIEESKNVSGAFSEALKTVVTEVD